MVTVGGSKSAELFDLALASLAEPFQPQLGSRRTIGSKAIHFILQAVDFRFPLPIDPLRERGAGRGDRGEDGHHF